MRDPGKPPFWRRHGWAIVLAGVAFVAVGAAAYLAGLAGTGRSLPGAYYWEWQPTAGASPAPPLTPFAQVDPRIVDALTYQQGVLEARPLLVLGEVMPVGAYVPRTGAAQFALQTPLPPPTLAPIPSPPTQFEQAEDAGILPTPSSPLGGPAPLAYGGDDCAPHGLPVSGLLTQRFHAWHSGVDFGIPEGTPVRATHSGRVIFVGWSTVGYGNLVILQNGAFSTYYAHLSAFNVVQDQLVGRESIIAWSGNTGNSSGPHIHYETRINDVPVDPLTFERRGHRWC